MERPTCKTCPYWWHDDFEGDPRRRDGSDYAECRRRAPEPRTHLNGSPEAIASANDTADNSPIWATTADWDWCGEHPDVPAYIKAVRHEQELKEVRASST